YWRRGPRRELLNLRAITSTVKSCLWREQPRRAPACAGLSGPDGVVDRPHIAPHECRTVGPTNLFAQLQQRHWSAQRVHVGMNDVTCDHASGLVVLSLRPITGDKPPGVHVPPRYSWMSTAS